MKINTRSRARKSLEAFSLQSDPEDSEGDCDSENEETNELMSFDDDTSSEDEDSDDGDSNNLGNENNDGNNEWSTAFCKCSHFLNFEKNQKLQ